ncbi:MAG: choice-of-anchor D domain-containing protein [Calditrichaceae bacterium]|nr:choice-of-anchor D domain-containing protein [Calditrichia bacterium]NUQ42695.1 choice-of-anchor D domain-containing protein [Calditrichaceae bacterium]
MKPSNTGYRLVAILFLFLWFFGSSGFAQAQQIGQDLSTEEYQQLKAAGKLPLPQQVEPPRSLRAESIIRPADGVQSNGLMVPLDTSFSVVPFTNGSPPEYRNDDGSTSPIPLSFTFTFYGSQYTQIYINNNGNLSFDGPYSSYSSTGFPINGFAMIAPFWADIDTRNPASGVVYYKSEANRFIIIWDSVGYYSQHADKVNTFELIITDGSDPLIGIGNNVCFSYGDMQWTTGDASNGAGGFGGIPSTVGANKGDGVNYALVGRFDHEGVDYDGPGGNPDGVSYLDNKHFCFNVAQGAGTISGTVFLDANGNGIQDPAENGLPGWTVRIDPGPQFTTTDVNGNYFFSFLAPNLYTVSEILKPNWTQTYPAPPGTHTVNVDSGQTFVDIDFGNQPIANVQDLSVSVAGGVARPGFQKFYGIVYQNKGTIAVNGTVIFTLPPQLGYLDSSPGGVYNAGNHTVAWDLGSLPAGLVGWLWVKAQIPANVPLGTALTSSALINPIAGDVFPADNRDSETQIVRGSFDPNDKEVSPVGVGPSGLITREDTLTYQIRFQNVGTDTAFNIVVRDLLDEDLDLSTVRIGASSHPFTFGIVDPRELVWTFTDIRLPDSTTNEAASHGFVKFTVKPKASAAAGAIIQNSAAIYFDFNAPVITNVVQNQIANDVGNIAISPTGHNFGSVDVGSNASHTFVLSNEDLLFGSLNISAVTLAGANPEQFAIVSGGGSFTLGPGGTRNIVVRFQPTSLGAMSAILRITSNDPDENPLDVALSGSGTGTAFPNISINTTSYNFGLVTVGLNPSPTYTLVVTNAPPGGATLVVDSVTVSGKNADLFNIVSGGGAFTLGLNASRNIVIRFIPNTVGNMNAALKVYSNDPDTPVYNVALLGKGGLEVTTAVFQNPAATKYADVVVASNVFLSAAPTVRAWMGNDTSAIPMSLISGSGKIYKGAYQFTATGNYSLSTRVEVGDFDSTLVRSFAVALMKPGMNQSITALNGRAMLRVGEDALREETCFLADYRESAQETLYQFGPAKTFDKPLTLLLNYDESVYPDPGKLFIYQKQGESWAALESQVFSGQRQVRAFVNTLGEFKLGYDASYSGSNVVPTELVLKQNYPNPFNPATTIEYDLPQDGNVTVAIYNMLGQKVKTLANGFHLAGVHRVEWNGTDERGNHLASGVYFYHLQVSPKEPLAVPSGEAGQTVQTRKLLLLR